MMHSLSKIEDMNADELDNIDAVYNEMRTTRQIRVEGSGFEKSPLRF
jgi:hypothetical protein